MTIYELRAVAFAWFCMACTLSISVYLICRTWEKVTKIKYNKDKEVKNEI